VEADIRGHGHHLAGLERGTQAPQALDLGLISARLQHASHSLAETLAGGD
jgi:hypothetical protein